MPIANGGPRCTRIKLNGERCQLPPIKGAVVCGSHGGRAPQVRAAAARRVAEAKAAAAVERWSATGDMPEVTDPYGELMKLAGMAAAWRDYAAAQVERIQEEMRYSTHAGEQLRAEVAVFERAMDRSAKVLESIARLDIADKQVRLQAAQVALVVTLVQRVLDDLDLTTAQQERAVTVVPGHMLELAAGTGRDADSTTRSPVYTGPRVSPGAN